jgi:hypothetical protein
VAVSRQAGLALLAQRIVRRLRIGRGRGTADLISSFGRRRGARIVPCLREASFGIRPRFRPMLRERIRLRGRTTSGDVIAGGGGSAVIRDCLGGINRVATGSPKVIVGIALGGMPTAFWVGMRETTKHQRFRGTRGHSGFIVAKQSILFG